MNTTFVCREVRPATDNSKRCLIIASQDERADVRAMDLTAVSDLTVARDRLRAQGIVLGGPLQPAATPSNPSSPASPLVIIAHDEHGKEHRLIVDHREEYNLSSGSTLYYFSVPEASCDCRWLVGRTLEVADESRGSFTTRSVEVVYGEP
jgi:hypothetical protein